MAAPSPFLDYWYTALATPIGVYLLSPDPKRLMSCLYTARAKARDPSIAHLQLRTSPRSPKDELLIFNPAAIDGA